jgi:hypothetical protein
VGFQVALQGLVLGPSGAGVPLELSNAVPVTIAQ